MNKQKCLIQALFFSNSKKLYKNCYGVFKKKSNWNYWFFSSDGFLDNSASLKTLNADFDAGNESVPNYLQRKKRSKLHKV